VLNIFLGLSIDNPQPGKHIMAAMFQLLHQLTARGVKLEFVTQGVKSQDQWEVFLKRTIVRSLKAADRPIPILIRRNEPKVQHIAPIVY